MAYATNEERKALREANDFPLDFVVRFEKGGRKSELCADDIEHALTLQKQWIDAGAVYVEFFRVLCDGTLNPILGAYTKADHDHELDILDWYEQTTNELET